MFLLLSEPTLSRPGCQTHPAPSQGAGGKVGSQGMIPCSERRLQGRLSRRALPVPAAGLGCHGKGSGMEHKVPQQPEQMRAGEALSASSPCLQILLQNHQSDRVCQQQQLWEQSFYWYRNRIFCSCWTRSVFNKQQTQSHQLCWGSLDTVPLPGTAASSQRCLPFLPAQTSA